MNHLDVVVTEGCKASIETRLVLDDVCSRMLRSIQDSLGFGASEDAILKWLEGCSLEGVERLTIVLQDYLQNRMESEL